MSASTPTDRRRFLRGGAAALAGFAVWSPGGGTVGATRTRAAQVAPGLDIVPRSTWGGDLRPKGQLPPEPDVRFLLVHHTAGPNTYGPDGVVRTLRGIYAFHTGTEKGWPDVAYNFFVDRYGTVWEGRTGSLESQIAGSATGGNQGFSQLCCFVGDFTAEAPPLAAVASMGRLLGWLGIRAGIDLRPGATTSFTSKGSNKWAAGREVSTATIAGHRDMSQTSCPGAACYALVQDGTFTRLALEAASGSARTVPATPTTTDRAATEPTVPTTPSTTSTTAVTTTTTTPTTTTPTTTTPTTTTPTTLPTTSMTGAGRETSAIGSTSSATPSALPRVATGAAATALAAGAAALVVRQRRGHIQPDAGDGLAVAAPIEEAPSTPADDTTGTDEPYVVRRRRRR
jgi:hypothetical protein